MTVSATTWVRSLVEQVPSTGPVLTEFGVDILRDEVLDSTLYDLAERHALDLGALSRALRQRVREQEGG